MQCRHFGRDYSRSGGDDRYLGPSETKAGDMATKSGGSQTELIGWLENTVQELYDLLEQYAPVWYTQELHEKAEAALKLVAEAGNGSGKPKSRARAS